MAFLKQIEEKWQRNWERAKIFEANPDPEKPKCFITVAYPYPNSPQHIGHGRTYTLTDVHARYMRMQGYNVLLPMAFHYTGTPVLAMSKRLADNDEQLVSDFVNVYKIPKEKLKELTNPTSMARYFHEEIKTGMKEIGYSIDWRREFTTIDPAYNRFIEWQFKTLRKNGYISRGSHPVGWCPKDGNPVGMHDTVGDVEPEIGEFTVIKFRQDNQVFPTATLRPETVFGVTNIWLNPKTQYAITEVDGETWIVSQEAAEKLSHQNRKVKVRENIEGRRLIGQNVENPATHTKIPILPADFVDPKNATGVVMSVPGHAPYDYVALESLKKKPSTLEHYGFKTVTLDSVKPIYLIEIVGQTTPPTADVINQMKIQNQKDPKLENATKEVYRQEFHNGKMKANTGKYAGLSVGEAKDKVRQDLIKEGKATTMYELLNRPVLCRCKTECIVKIVQDQWFIDYGKPQWKTLAHKNLDRMEILPEELRQEYSYVIDWLHEKACARKSGMGTRLPWDKDWIIESLSDSTIYMAYYTIAQYIKEHKIEPTQLTDEVFDYIFLSMGKADEIAKKANLEIELLKRMHDEFMYFYPLDSRHSARELIPNHLTFMIFNHVAIFPENMWPHQIVTNGHVLMEGAKMSKSFGNIIPLHEGLTKFGADPIRLGVLGTAELLQDADFSPAIAKAMQERLKRLHAFAREVTKTSPNKHSRATLIAIDKWMLSRLQKHIRKVTENMDKLAIRKAIQTLLYELDQDLQWYQKRTSRKAKQPKRNEAITQVFRTVLDAQIRMLAPVAPHICEELWEIVGGKSFVATSSWPKPDEARIALEIEENEALIMDLLDDTQKILKATGMTPHRVCYYTAARWKREAYLKMLKRSLHGETTTNGLLRELASQKDLREHMKEIVKIAPKIQKEVVQLTEEKKQSLLKTEAEDERATIQEAIDFISDRFKAEVSVYAEGEEGSYDPKHRASTSMPGRPAIYIE